MKRKGNMSGGRRVGGGGRCLGKFGNLRKDKLHFKFEPSISRTKIRHYKQNIKKLIILHSLHIQYICILTNHFNVIYCNNDNLILITELIGVEFHRCHITSTGNNPCHVTSQYSIKYLANMVHRAYINSTEQETFWHFECCICRRKGTVSIVTRLDDQRIRVKFFAVARDFSHLKASKELWVTPILLSNGYEGLFPHEYRSNDVKLPPLFCLVLKLRKHWAILQLAHISSWCGT
jgi:hypothetical protein